MEPNLNVNVNMLQHHNIELHPNFRVIHLKQMLRHVIPLGN